MFDNFFAFHILISNDFSTKIFVSVILAAAAGVFSYKAKFLTFGGAITASVMAFVFYSMGGERWLIPIIVFFVFSSILSKVRKYKNPEVEKYFEKTGVRDYKQVIANGGFGIILILLDYFIKSEQFYLSYIGLLSVVCADTWATEIGTMFRVKTYNVLNLKNIEQGTSGGISVAGFVGSILGSTMIALSSYVWIKSGLIQFILIVIFVGLIGNIIDSLIGAIFQAQYICKICNLVTEKKVHCNSRTMLVRGKKWIDNDMVNLIAGISGCISILLFQQLI